MASTDLLALQARARHRRSKTCGRWMGASDGGSAAVWLVVGHGALPAPGPAPALDHLRNGDDGQQLQMKVPRRIRHVQRADVCGGKESEPLQEGE